MFRDQIAQLAYEAVRAYRIASGDHPPAWADAGPAAHDHAMGLVNAFYNRAVGPEAYHNGLIESGEHPDMAAFDRLPRAVQIEAHMYRAIVHQIFPPHTKPETQRASVQGFDAHRGMGAQ